MDLTTLNSMQSRSTAMSSAVQGAKKAEDSFSKAATEVVNSYAAAANVVSGADASPETIAAASDPVSPLVDMKTSQRAYEASLKVISTVDEMEKEVLDIRA